MPSEPQSFIRVKKLVIKSDKIAQKTNTRVSNQSVY